MSFSPEAYAITLKLTPAQHQWLADTAKTLSDLSGQPVAHSALIMRLLELGAPQLGQELAVQQARAAATKKPVPRLQLIRGEG